MKTSLRLICSLLILTLSGGNAVPQWIAEKSPVSVNLNAIALFSETSGCIVGDNGVILSKDQEGWILYDKITDENLYAVVLTGEDSGWAVGARGTILQLDGTDWKICTSPTREKLYSLSFKDNNHGYAAGANGTLLEYQDGTWKLLKTNTRANLYSIAYHGDFFIVGGGQECRNIPVMKINENDNHKLEKIFDSDFTEIKCISVTSDKHAWAVGHPGKIFFFNGNRWDPIQIPENIGALNSISFSKGKGIAVGHNGRILTYNGDQWESEESNTNSRFNGTAVAGTTFYAIGNDGTILKSKSISEPVKNTDSKYLSFSPYPNPSTESIRFVKPENTNDQELILITVTNASGQVILNKSISGLTGNQEYQLDISEFGNGIYFIHLKSPTFKASGRFLVSR
jgi:photosystem II stability/assembly factor-like uncharacterized protein